MLPHDAADSPVFAGPPSLANIMSREVIVRCRGTARVTQRYSRGSQTADGVWHRGPRSHGLCEIETEQRTL